MRRRPLSRERVVAAAVSVVDEGGSHGFQDLTLAAVAQRTGVAVPSLYKHIDSLADLRRDVAVVSVREFGDTVAEAIAGRSGADAVRAMAHAARRYARAHPARYTAAQVAPDPEAPTDADLRAEGQRVVDLVAAALRGFRIPEDWTVDAVRALRSAIHGFVSLEIGGGFRLPQDRDRSFDLLVDAVIRGLLAEFAEQPGTSSGTSRPPA